MKHIDIIFIMIQSPLLATWMITAKDIISFTLSTILTIVTILYIYEKRRLTRAERKAKEKELNE